MKYKLSISVDREVMQEVHKTLTTQKGKFKNMSNLIEAAVLNFMQKN